MSLLVRGIVFPHLEVSVVSCASNQGKRNNGKTGIKKLSRKQLLGLLTVPSSKQGLVSRLKNTLAKSKAKGSRSKRPFRKRSHKKGYRKTRRRRRPSKRKSRKHKRK